MNTTRHALTVCLAALTPGVATQQRNVEKVASGFGFVEGPAWHPRAGYLLFSDISGNTIHKLDNGEVSVFLTPSERANGLAFDAEGQLYVCQGGARRLLRIDADGKQTVLAAKFDGAAINSPNDLALDDHGGVYFTDPRYGKADDLEQKVMAVYYVPRSGDIVRVTAELPRPNGILVSRGGSGLYVAEPDRRQLWYFPILSPGRVGHGRVLFTGEPETDGGGPDGMAMDERGNLYATYAGIVVLDAAGHLLERIAIPERPANCTFGGADGKTLFVTARTGLYAMRLDIAGAPARSMRATLPPDVDLPSFERVVIDAEVGIGYGTAIADVGGSAAPDIVLVDRGTVAWYENPTWTKHVIARQLTPRDHVCVAARDIDGDGLADIAIGAGWNPADTTDSGSLHYLVAGTDRTAPWQPVQLPHEPTVHRARWLRAGPDAWRLLVAPLHGRGNRDGQGAGVRLLEYWPDRGEPERPWHTALLDDRLHQTHNVEPVAWDDDPEDEVLVAAREGVFLFDRQDAAWTGQQLVAEDDDSDFGGASEVRTGRLPSGRRFVTTIEPFHGHQLVLYVPPEAGSPRSSWCRTVLTADLAEGHALACGDLLGKGHDQIVVGWRAKNVAGAVGVRMYVPRDADGRHWQSGAIDTGGMACEDLRLGDLDGDGGIDVVAAGRATHNLVVYRNRR